jgi:GNAT superfamily N-acetyltransferase
MRNEPVSTIKVRQAPRRDLPWVNERYGEVEFIPSDESDYIAIAELDGKPAGIGRIVNIDDNKGELGGMYVFEGYRGSGVSRAVIEHLLRNSHHAILYCLPFENLEKLYASFGFKRVKDLSKVPGKVLEKYRWCNEFYAKPVLLLELALQDFIDLR